MQKLQISKEGIEHAEIARLAFTRTLAVSPVSFGWSQRTVRFRLSAHQRRIEMACAGCERRRAKLKKLMELANERFNELKQRITGSSVSGKAADGEDRKAD